MAATRRLQPSPVPTPELAQLKETLDPHYGSSLWDPEGQRVLVVRVPRDEPDLVNDLEQAVEHLAPADLSNTPSCLLVGHTKSHLVSTHLLHDLMVARLDFDARQCAGLRAGIGAGQYRMFKAPEDPHKLLRMLVRVGRPSVADVTEDDLEAVLVEVGPRAEQPPYKDVQVVYLVADKDHLRITGPVFVGDLRSRWSEQAERRHLAAEVEAKEKAQRLAEEQEREEALVHAQAAAAKAAAEAACTARLADRPAPPAVTAPLRGVNRPAGARTWSADDATAAEIAAAASPNSPPTAPGAGAGAGYVRPTPWTGAGSGGMSVAERAAMYAHLDGLENQGRARPVGLPTTPPVWPRGAAAPTPPAELGELFPQGALWPRRVPAAPESGPSQVVHAPSSAPAPRAEASASPVAAAVRERLAALRFEVLVKPPVPGIDMAAERAEGYPQRVIVFTPERLDEAVAAQVLAKARELDADMALVVCAQADADAKRRFIATKARHVDPAELPALEL